MWRTVKWQWKRFSSVNVVASDMSGFVKAATKETMELLLLYESILNICHSVSGTVKIWTQTVMRNTAMTRKVSLQQFAESSLDTAWWTLWYRSMHLLHQPQTGVWMPSTKTFLHLPLVLTLLILRKPELTQRAPRFQMLSFQTSALDPLALKTLLISWRDNGWRETLYWRTICWLLSFLTH